MDKDYQKEIIQAAIDKINDAGKPLSEAQLIAGAVHRLKMKKGRKDKRHSSKGRFKKDSFKFVVTTNDWKEVISQLPNNKYVLKSEYAVHDTQLSLDEKWNWNNETKASAIKKMLGIFKGIDPYKFEDLVRMVLAKDYPYYSFETTKNSGDGGIDVKGSRIDPNNPGKQEVIYVSVKRYKANVGREVADSFIGAVYELVNANESGISKFEGIIIAAGKIGETTVEKMAKSCKTGITFFTWDGDKLAHKMMKHGMGITASIDLDFWREVDEKMIPVAKK
jgi:restriction endonuclease Mrr